MESPLYPVLRAGMEAKLSCSRRPVAGGALTLRRLFFARRHAAPPVHIIIAPRAAPRRALCVSDLLPASARLSLIVCVILAAPTDDHALRHHALPHRRDHRSSCMRPSPRRQTDAPLRPCLSPRRGEAKGRRWRIGNVAPRRRWHALPSPPPVIAEYPQP